MIFYLSGPARWPAKIDAEICLAFEVLIITSTIVLKFKYSEKLYRDNLRKSLRGIENLWKKMDLEENLSHVSLKETMSSKEGNVY